MDAQIRSTKQAQQNSLDAISLTQTAEGILGEKVQILQRMRELLVYASNDVLDQRDRDAIQAEIEALSIEVNDMDAHFNQRAVFRDHFNFAVDTGPEDLDLELNLSRLAHEPAGTLYKKVGGAVDATQGLQQGALQFTLGQSQIAVRASRARDDQKSTTNAESSAIAKAAAINDSVGDAGIQALARDTIVKGSVVRGATLDTANYLTINGQKISGFEFHDYDADGVLRSSINAVSEETGVVATMSDAGGLVLTANDGRNVEIGIVGNASQTGLADGLFGGQICILAEGSCEFDLATTNDAVSLGMFESASGNALEIDFTDAGGAASLEGATTTGLWHLSQQRSVSAPDAARYADPATNNFNTGGQNSGELVTPNIDLSGVTSAALAFDYFMDTESGGFDLLEVHVRTGGGDTRVLAKTDFTVDRAFHNIDVDLSAFVGQNISLAFSFDTTDGIANNGEGVYLDNIVVSTDTAQLNFVLGQEETADLQTLNLNSAITREENLVSIDYAIRRFSQARSELGALHNSLESHINTLEERIFSTSSAQSRIVDADIAVEVASLAKAQITQQAAREMHALLQDSMALIVDLLE